MFISSTSELVDDGTLWPIGQHVNWNSCTVFVGALTPAISSVSEIIWLQRKRIDFNGDTILLGRRPNCIHNPRLMCVYSNLFQFAQTFKRIKFYSTRIKVFFSKSTKWFSPLSWFNHSAIVSGPVILLKFSLISFIYLATFIFKLFYRSKRSDY